MKTIYLATDHAGFALKEVLRQFLTEGGYTVVDCGAHAFDAEDDYPDFIQVARDAVQEMPTERVGIILGGSGTGEAIVANRGKGIRACVYYGGSLTIVSLAREHNDANMLSLGARFVNEEEAKEAVRLFLHTDFSREERHVRRIQKIDQQ